MGTMYPAIDTTAGERERGTLETILTLPVTNQELIFSKFLTVGTIGVASALLNVLSMGGIGVSVQTGGTDDQYGFENTGVKIRSGNLSLLPVYSCFCSFDQCAFHVFLRICKDLQGGK